MFSIGDSELIVRIHTLGQRLGLSDEAVLAMAVEERRVRFQDDYQDRMQRIDERWGVADHTRGQNAFMEIDDLMYDDRGLPQ